MTRVALRGLLARKTRAILTALAIVLGVGMISGTFMLTDSIQRAFDAVFQSSYAHTDAVVSAKSQKTTLTGTSPTVPPSLVGRIQHLPGVRIATGELIDFNQQTSAVLLDRHGRTVSSSGRTFTFGVDPTQQRFNPLTLASGRWASGPGEVVIDASTAHSQGLHLGEQVAVNLRGKTTRYRLVGTARFGGVSSIGATIEIFDVPTAQRLLGVPGYTSISIAAKPGVTPDQVVSQVAPLLPPTTQVKTGAEQANAAANHTNKAVQVVRYILLAFGGIALFVGGFVIFNTLTITVAQRTRELATLRTLGASRRQVLRSVLVEALAIGIIASVIGLMLGVGLAKGLAWMFSWLGVNAPQSGLVVAPRTVTVSLTAGTLITLVAGLVPALRSTRVPPINAVREGAAQPTSTVAQSLPIVSVGILIGSIGGLVYATLGTTLPTGLRMLLLGAGIIGTFLGVALLAKYIVRPLASVLGWPTVRLGGVAGALASHNARRNPARTASTASALMIGVALISFMAVLANGVSSSESTAANQQLRAQYVITSSDTGSGGNSGTTFPRTSTTDATRLPGVVWATAVRSASASVGTSQVTVSGIDPATITNAYHFAWARGTDRTVRSLTAGEAILRKDFATSHHLSIGDTFTLSVPGGPRIRAHVAGIYAPPVFDPLLGHVLITQHAFDTSFRRPQNLYTFLDATGPQPTRLAALERSLASQPEVSVHTKGGFIRTLSAGTRTTLNLVYVLLGLSIVVSLFGMINTLVLSTFERTREIGMLRAIGLTRRQTRRMIRHESITTALIGTALGLTIGILLAALITYAFANQGIALALPYRTLGAFVAIAITAGMLAAVMPARRAAKLDVLDALHYE